MENTPDLAFPTSHERRELLRRVLIEIENKTWKAKKEKERAGLLADGNLFNRAPRRIASTLASLSGGQGVAYIEQNKSANKLIKDRQKKAREANSLRRSRERKRNKVSCGRRWMWPIQSSNRTMLEILIS